jgi:hypothetical protein
MWIEEELFRVEWREVDLDTAMYQCPSSLVAP